MLSYFFSDTPPNQPTMTAVQELCRIVESNPNNIQALDPVKDFKLRDLDLVDKFTKLNQFKERFLGFMCVHDPLFEENVCIRNVTVILLCKEWLSQYYA